MPVFDLLREIGDLPDSELYRTFNMGIGMVVIASPEDAGTVREHLGKQGEEFFEIGRIVKGPQSVTLVTK